MGIFQWPMISAYARLRPRLSTELMLKAREPRLYAEFIITLAKRLRQSVLDNYGVFGKFTDDGILAFLHEPMQRVVPIMDTTLACVEALDEVAEHFASCESKLKNVECVNTIKPRRMKLSGEV